MKSPLLLLSSLAIFLCLAQPIQAQMEARNGFEEGFKAIQFGIGNNFRLTTFDGSSLSLMKYTSDSEATFFRFSFNTQYRKIKDEADQSLTRPEDETQTSENELSHNSFDNSFSLTMGKQNYIKTESDVLPFITKKVFIGTTISTDNRSDSNDNNEGNTSINSSMLDRKDISFRPFLGLGMGIGVDYFIAKNINLNAQTGLQFQYLLDYNSSDQDIELTNTLDLVTYRNSSGKRTTHTFNLQSTGVLFGISAFF